MVLHSKLRVICRALVPAVLLAMSLQACAEFALIPAPKEQKDVRVSLINRGIALHCESSDPEDRFAATDLRAYLLDRGLQLRPGGIPIDLLRSESARGHEALRASRVQWDEEKMGPEGYVIVPAGSGIAVIAKSATGLFYGAQTAKQLIDSSVRPAVLHVTIIRDWPTMKIRGLSDDLSRGPVPTLDFLKKQIRTFAEYKMNLYSPYFEHTFQYASNPLIAPVDGAITAGEGRELVAYAARFHVSIAPEQEAFGHLHNVLKWELYAPLAETPHGQVLAPGDPGSFAMRPKSSGRDERHPRCSAAAWHRCISTTCSVWQQSSSHCIEHFCSGVTSQFTTLNYSVRYLTISKNQRSRLSGSTTRIRRDSHVSSAPFGMLKCSAGYRLA